MPAFFLDTSTVLKRYVQESGTPWVQALAAPAAGHSLISSHLVKDQEQAPHDLVGRMAGGDDDPVVGLARCKVSSGKRFEIRSIVSQEGFLPAYGTRHLLRIAGLELAGVTSRGGREAACPEQIRHQYVNIFIQVEFGEEAIHDPFTSGSIRLSGIRFRSIC